MNLWLLVSAWGSTGTCLGACEGGWSLWVDWNEFLCLTLLVEMDACGGLGFEQRERQSNREGRGDLSKEEEEMVAAAKREEIDCGFG